jgi:Domain of unknown function (DUF4383)
MDSVPIAERTGWALPAWSPAQITSFAIGAWWVANGIGALLIDPNFATGRVHGNGELLGVSITANGWHALFHLLPGVAGLAAAWRPRAAIVFLIVAGALYIVVGVWGLIVATNSVGVISVDTSGDVVHLIEGLVPFAIGVRILQLQNFRLARPS